MPTTGRTEDSIQILREVGVQLPEYGTAPEPPPENSELREQLVKVPWWRRLFRRKG